MHLLFADSLPEQTIADLEARGHVCVMEPGLKADDLPGADRRVRRTGRAQHQGQARGVRGRGPPVAGDPGRGGDEHDRHRRRRHSWCAGVQRPRPQRCRRRRADHGTAAGDRPPDRGQRGRPAQRSVGQEALQQGTRSARVDHGRHRPRLDRPCRGRARRRVRHPGPGAREARPVGVHRITDRGARHRDVRLDGRPGVLVRHRQPARPLFRRHQAPGRQGFPRQDAAGRDPRSTPRGATSSTRAPCSRRWRPARSAPAWTSSTTSPAPAGRRGTPPSPDTPASSRPITSVRRPSRRSAPSRPG